MRRGRGDLRLGMEVDQPVELPRAACSWRSPDPTPRSVLIAVADVGRMVSRPSTLPPSLIMIADASMSPVTAADSCNSTRSVAVTLPVMRPPTITSRAATPPLTDAPAATTTTPADRTLPRSRPSMRNEASVSTSPSTLIWLSNTE